MASSERRLVGLIALVAIAARVWHLGQGLPDFGEEAIPFRVAFDMWGWGTGRIDLHPHLFHYPSLTFYLQFFVQALHMAIGRLTGAFASPADYFVSYHLDPTPMVIAARLVGVLADAATVVAAGAIAGRLRPWAGVAAAVLVAFAPTLLLTARLVFTDTVMTALALWAIERMIAYRLKGGTRRLVTCAVLIGLAAGTKYPAAALVVPLALVALERDGRRGVVPAVLGGATAFLVFVATSPYVVLDFESFRRDFGFVTALGARGHLGKLEGTGFLLHLHSLIGDIGWIGIALLAVSFAIAVARARSEPVWRDLWLCLLLFGVPISIARIEAIRYVLPIVPLAAILAAATAVDLAARVRAVPVRLATAIACGALVAQVIVAGVSAASAGVDTTQGQVRRWLQRRLTGREMFLQEGYGARLVTTAEVVQTSRLPVFAKARPELRERFMKQTTYRAVTIPLVVSGTALSYVRIDGRQLEIEIFPHAVDLNQFFYEPGALAQVDLVLTSSAVRARYEAEPARFPHQMRFYRVLDEIGTIEARFEPRPGVDGPGIRVYRLERAAWDTLAARTGPLDPLWWAERVPASYRSRADQALAEIGPPSGGALRDASGEPSLWVRSLRSMFEEKLDPFTYAMALELSKLDRCAAALPFAEASTLMRPEEIAACLLYLTCAQDLGRWSEARRAIERTSQYLATSREDLSLLRLNYAAILSHTGEPDRARRLLERLIASVDPQSSVARNARRMLDEMAGGR